MTQMDSSYEEDARLSPTKSKKGKGRSSTTLPGIIKDESYGVQKIIHYNELGQPIGDVQYPSCRGVLARTMVPIVYKDWHKIPKELKEKLWSCVESAYNVDPSRKKKTLSSIGEKWRTFKKYLSKHIRQYKSNPKFLSIPPEIYPFIEQRHWNSFMRDRLTERFEVQSNIQRARQSRSIYNHRLGRKGYARFQEELKQKT
ncbi:hypothetical protein CsSME_00008073 [Camellia sinensis var. sinensis]